MEDAERVARTRFFTIGAVRLMGAITLALGAAISLERFAGIPPYLGYALLAIGAFEMVVLPQFLVSRWKSPPKP